MANIINGTDTGSGGLITTGDSSDELQLQTAETTAITITSGQQSAFIAGTASAPAVTTTGDLNTGIFFPAGDAVGVATNGAEAARFNSSGNLVFPNGQGIDFSASAGGGATSSLLDDYEEGTFTAGATIGSGSVTVANTAVCRYTKIGNQVHVVGRPNLNGSGSGALRITGLPFTSIGTASGANGAQLLPISMSGSTGNANQFIGYITASSTDIIIVYTAGAGFSDTAGAYIDSDTDVFLGFTYTVA